ncbi:carboxymuconolactone decarboxylase family protein [Nocardia aurantia]|uniref:Carboxymuconolactone decarboxylase-like domain-containing protein n=1 Tax=Nocardia aurantia TaxID=2585199 RepID=A0A7K0DU18_9NOCA|nr:carboxymuconolactone decarboxylase family protein [Nocardia aurantia]MQY29236.1 hypothetical protein [Nocardia aurantia]
MTTSVPRLAPLPPEQWDEDARALLRGRVGLADRYLSGAPDAPRMPNVLGVLGHHPELAAAWLSYNGVLLQEPALDPLLRELVILRVAARTGSDYEWHQHVRIGTRLGLSAAQIDAIGAPAGGPALSPVEVLLLVATDELLDGHRLGDRTWAELSGHFDARQLLELLFVAGSYLCLALVFNSVALQPDPDIGPGDRPASPETEVRP